MPTYSSIWKDHESIISANRKIIIWRNEWKNSSYQITIVSSINIMKDQFQLNNWKIKSNTLLPSRFSLLAHKSCELFHFLMFFIVFILFQESSIFILEKKNLIQGHFGNSTKIVLKTWTITALILVHSPDPIHLFLMCY